MAKLPSAPELRRLFHLGMKDTEVAEQYEVTRQAVQKRWREMNLVADPFRKQVQDLLRDTYDLSGSTEGSRDRLGRQLREYLRRQLGDTLSREQQKRVTSMVTTLREKGWLLAYSAEMGWQYAARTAADGNLVVRWPTGKPLPEGRLRRALEMPEPGKETTPIDP